MLCTVSPFRPTKDNRTFSGYISNEGKNSDSSPTPAPGSFLTNGFSYYNPPTLRHSPTSRIRGLNLKGPGGRPRGRGKWRPQENKTQPTATASTGGKRVICGRNAQKCQKYSVGKCPSGARRNRSTGGLNRNYIALNVSWRAAASNLEERPKTAENGRVWRVFDAAAGRRRENLLRFTIGGH